MESLLYAAGTIQINFTSRRTVESVAFRIVDILDTMFYNIFLKKSFIILNTI